MKVTSWICYNGIGTITSEKMTHFMVNLHIDNKYVSSSYQYAIISAYALFI